MELSIKTTILFSKRLYKSLKSLSAAKKRSLGDLVRTACEKQYGLASSAEAETAVEELARLALPVGPVAEMKKQLQPDTKGNGA